MKIQIAGPVLLFLIFAGLLQDCYSQSSITINKTRFNTLDRKNRKQGDWIFFDQQGNIQLSCRYENDRLAGPVCWYENTDTSFLRFPAEGNRETFVLYENGKKFIGDFILNKDSSYQIEMEPDSAITGAVISRIKAYRVKKTSPLYYFGQKKLADYMSMAFNSSKYNFNKHIYLLLTVDEAGRVREIEFPQKLNRLSAEEERDLYSIFIGMPRWQPVFDQNGVRPFKVMLSRHSSISYTSAEQ